MLYEEGVMISIFLYLDKFAGRVTFINPLPEFSHSSASYIHSPVTGLWPPNKQGKLQRCLSSTLEKLS